MRRMGIFLLAMALVWAAPAWSSSGEGKGAPAAKKDGAPATATPKSAAKSAEPVKPANAELASELARLEEMIQAQSKQIEVQQKQIETLQHQISVRTPASSPAPPPAADATAMEPATAVAEAPVAAASSAKAPTSAQPAIAAPPSPGAVIRVPAARGQEAGVEKESPLQFHIGSAYVTPVGFMDFTGVWRSNTGGSGIGTNFGSIPYGDTIQTNLSEFRFSMQNSRIGFRVDANVDGAHVIGYMEADFLGVLPGNVAVSSNSSSLRSRLYWVDLTKGRWEVMGGQSWSLLTPGRSGISPLPGNIFFTQNMDVNYQAGLFWGRIPELRVVYHPSSKAAFALAIDSPEQYMGGSAGGGSITLPASLRDVYPANELDNGNSTLSVPNVAPDFIAKLALDPSPHFHFEVGGIMRQFKLYNPQTAADYSATGGGGFINLGFDLFKGFRILSNNFWSDGGGRYIFGQAPDLIVRADGSPSLVHSGSTVTGFEFTHQHTLIFGYYGGIYVSRNIAADANGNPIGYGYPGSPSSQNRSIQEGTVGLNQTIWTNPRYGSLNFISQYSYLTRNPWSIATGQPKNASLNMVFFDLRYTLPGSAPAMK